MKLVRLSMLEGARTTPVFINPDTVRLVYALENGDTRIEFIDKTSINVTEALSSVAAALAPEGKGW